MKLTGYKVKNQKALGLFAAGVVVLMFVIRYFLLSSGTIDEMYTLDEEELYDALTAYEVTVSAADSSSGEVLYIGGGTILDARKQSTSDENYTLTIVTARAVTGTQSEGRTITILLPDGSEMEGSLLSMDESNGFALIQCLYPEESEVYYSLDILYRLAEEDPVYVLSDGALTGGAVTDPDAELDGVEDDVIVSSMNTTISDIMEGAGLYGKSGNYLGMLTDIGEDGLTLQSIPADLIMAALNAAL